MQRYYTALIIKNLIYTHPSSICTMEQFFHGLKVVDLASVLAGPAVGAFFQELGATVIKVENETTGGDVTRNWKGPLEFASDAYSAYWASVNLGKEVVLKNLTDARDQQYVHDLVKTADVVISNFKPRSARRMNMDYGTMARLNPRIIFAELTSFGREGEGRPAFDVVLQAEAGFLYMTGSPGGPPVKMPVALIDLLAGHQLKEAILMGLLERERSGAGCFITVSLLDAAIASLANQANNWLMGGQIPQRMGTLHPNIAPYGEIFDCADGLQIVLAVGTEKHFSNLCKILNCEELIKDNRFSTNAARVRHRTELYPLLAKAIQKQKRGDLLNSLHHSKVPVGSIKTMKEVFETEGSDRMVIEGKLPDGTPAKRVRTAAFELKRLSSDNVHEVEK